MVTLGTMKARAALLVEKLYTLKSSNQANELQELVLGALSLAYEEGKADQRESFAKLMN